MPLRINDSFNLKGNCGRCLVKARQPPITSTDFSLKHNRPFVSWVQDLEKERFHSAAETLLGESENAGDLAAKEVIGATCEYRDED
jgi:hypothetical protein